jgi:hypothetical protein
MRRRKTSAHGWRSGVDVLLPVLIGAAILAFVILIFAASSANHGSS